MLDIQFRPLKDQVFNPISRLVPKAITPLHVTVLAFFSGLNSCLHASQNHPTLSLTFWLLNRALDCLDGAVARHRNQSSDLGGFLDLLGDFIVYSLIPICCGLSSAGGNGERWHLWASIAVVEASFHVNNFVLFYVAAVVEKRKATAVGGGGELRDGDRVGEKDTEMKVKVKELTSVAMRPALVEGMESGIMFTIMLARPAWTEGVCWVMAVLVGVGICQRVIWLVPVLK